jgi:hypothetical protein
MAGTLRVNSFQNESGTFTIPVNTMQRRVIQRVSYTHRVGWWRGNNVLYWVPGGYVDFRPVRSDSRVRLTFSIPTRAYGSQHMIMHWVFYRDEVEYGRFTRGGHHIENAFAQEWDIPSWGENQYSRVGYKARSYSEGNHNAHLYLLQYWDGGGNSAQVLGQVTVEEYIPELSDRVQIFGTVGTSTWTAPAGVTSVRVLVAAGGGGGGMDMGGGGGGGGVIENLNFPVTPGQSYSVVVGAGGAGAPSAGTQTGSQGQTTHNFSINATNGGNSTFASITATGGGFGGTSYFTSPLGGAAGNGGCGGGRSGYSNDNTVRAGGTGIAGQGFNGGQGGPAYYSGGGGGAGGPGANSTNPAHGGPGKASDILGTTYYWGGGGGGSGYSTQGGSGGIGGGGGGAVGETVGGVGGLTPGRPGGGGSVNSQTNRPGGDAAEGTGGGGGGGSHYTGNNEGGKGGSGMVIIRWTPP